MHCRNYRKKTIKKKRKGGGNPLGIARRDSFVPKNQRSRKVQGPPPEPKFYERSASPLTKLSSSSSSKNSSSGSFKLPSTKKNKGKQKIQSIAYQLSPKDLKLAKERAKGMKVLTKLGAVTNSKDM